MKPTRAYLLCGGTEQQQTSTDGQHFQGAQAEHKNIPVCINWFWGADAESHVAHGVGLDLGTWRMHYSHHALFATCTLRDRNLTGSYAWHPIMQTATGTSIAGIETGR